MAQRFSGYERREREHYPTPEWVTLAVAPHFGQPAAGRVLWEPACGEGMMGNAFSKAGFEVVMSDIHPLTPFAETEDFLKADAVMMEYFGAHDIATNPPYGLAGAMAVAFIEKALALTQATGGRVAMLLKPDFDSAGGRVHLFRDHPAWSKKVVLLKRIVWFESGNGNGPSENHCWFIWDWQHSGPAQIFYEPADHKPARASQPEKPEQMNLLESGPNGAGDTT